MMNGAMRERKIGAPHFQGRQNRVVRHRPEGDDYFKIRERCNLCGEIGAACGDLRTNGLILRRHASYSVGDLASQEFETVIGIGAIVAVRKTELVQRRIQKIAGIVTGKRSPCSVGAPKSWR